MPASYWAKSVCKFQSKRPVLSRIIESINSSFDSVTSIKTSEAILPGREGVVPNEESGNDDDDDDEDDDDDDETSVQFPGRDGLSSIEPAEYNGHFISPLSND